MKILCDKQGTTEWLQARKGKLTASGAKLALSGRKTKGRRLYVEKIVDDLQGIPDFEDQETPPWFIAGRYYESFARGWYSFTYDVDVIETGFIVHDDYSFIGCSPDGLIEPDGLVEIKFRSYLHTFKEHSRIGYNASVMPQIQTQMFVTGKQWCDYVNYWRDDDNNIEQGSCERVYRDDSYIQNTLLPAFLNLWDDVRAELDRRESITRKRQYDTRRT